MAHVLEGRESEMPGWNLRDLGGSFGGIIKIPADFSLFAR